MMKVMSRYGSGQHSYITSFCFAGTPGKRSINFTLSSQMQMSLGFKCFTFHVSSNKVQEICLTSPISKIYIAQRHSRAITLFTQSYDLLTFFGFILVKNLKVFFLWTTKSQPTSFSRSWFHYLAKIKCGPFLSKSVLIMS